MSEREFRILLDLFGRYPSLRVMFAQWLKL